MQLFYSEKESDGLLYFTEEESAHCIKILRHKVGDLLNVTDGKGTMYKGKLVDDHPKKITVSVESKIENYNRRNYQLHIAISPTKSADRTEWFLEKATELGVDKVTFVFTQRTERKHINLDRMQKIALSAIKQSGQAKLPVLDEMPFPSFISSASSIEKFIAWLPEIPPPSLTLQAKPMSDSVVLIGPEGDFTEKETESALKLGFRPVSLGPNRLRTETAGIYVAALYNQISIEY